MALHPETVLAQSETNSVLRAGTIDRPRLARFARAVKSLDELDPALGTALAKSIEPGEAIRQIIAAPKQALLGVGQKKQSWLNRLLLWELTPDWVLVVAEGRVLVATVDRPRAMPVVTSTHIADMLSFETGKILLHGWVEWTFCAQNCADRTRIHYNTVGQRMFKEALDYMRQSVAGFPSACNDRQLEYLSDLPFKFMNIIAYDSLLPGEQVQAVVYQPAIWTTHLRLFRRQQAAARALVLTDRYLLIAEEELTGRADHWGLITRFFPRNRIRRATVVREPTGVCLQLILEHRGATQTVQLAFEPSAEAALDKLPARLQSQ